jgi:hypothetical protein
MVAVAESSTKRVQRSMESAGVGESDVGESDVGESDVGGAGVGGAGVGGVGGSTGGAASAVGVLFVEGSSVGLEGAILGIGVIRRSATMKGVVESPQSIMKRASGSSAFDER